jgi:hypothetical protein
MPIQFKFHPTFYLAARGYTVENGNLVLLPLDKLRAIHSCSFDELSLRGESLLPQLALPNSQ